ncbi:MAG: hypothetical protein Q4G14_14120 [Paracoccus sp. (in: a-proteobacteria)]|uniref:hypothetical protein n=1 Tax=Paracoccus sp. TaxID=267 RepID=UPI0026DFEDA2|nr:hypothetical protein [Paracoccus sp. (in: a-proteobacteria)]MDO5614363.1 hypothetical protein [Paracoccus sp. (in: a-proteobacteria)]
MKRFRQAPLVLALTLATAWPVHAQQDHSAAADVMQQPDNPEPPPSDSTAPLPADDGPAPDLALSREIGERGLASVQARLADLADPAPQDRFALAGLRFLGAIETALQARWQVGLSEEVGNLPVLRLPIPANPAPDPLRPELLAEVLADLTETMAQARAPLAGLEDEFGLDIDLADIWFDVNADGTREDGEGLIDIAGDLLGIGPAAPWAEPQPVPVIRFDTADAAWLSAYTHLMSGTAQVVLAYDPTGPIRDAMETRAAFAELTNFETMPLGGFVEDSWLDAVAIVINTLKQQPDTAHASAAHADFLAMIAENRRFWALVAQETDNTREWIPNAQQSSATGIALPPETGAAWQEVLAEVELVLNGEALIPYWRGDAGVNVRQVFLDPRPVDLIGWIQGASALPYLEQGEMASSGAISYFDMLMEGNGMLMAVWLN